jgi:hypothetical protein
MSKPKKRNRAAGGKEKWAHFRFGVIGPLLAAPPVRGDLTAELKDLAAKLWQHPVTGEWKKFGFSTIEPNDPVG